MFDPHGSRGVAETPVRRISLGRSAILKRASSLWPIGLLLLAAILCALVVPLQVFGASDPTEGTVFAHLAWGTGQSEVGLAETTEGLTRGPEALAVSPDGRVAILDSVNGRVMLLDHEGRPAGQIDVGLHEPRFLAVDDGSLYVLDVDASKKLATYSWSGLLVSELGLPDTDDVVTGLFATSEGACVEIGHQGSIFIGEGPSMQRSTHGSAETELERYDLPGRPLNSRLSEVIGATYRPSEGVSIQSHSVNESDLKVGDAVELRPTLGSGRSIEHLVSLDDDGSGGLLVGVRLLVPERHGQSDSTLVITRVRSADKGKGQGGGQSLQTAEEDVLYLTESNFAYIGAPYVVAPDGRIFQPISDSAGYTILIHSLEEVRP